MIGGMAGALCATLGVILPAFVIILLVARCFRAFQRSRIVRGRHGGTQSGGCRHDCRIAVLDWQTGFVSARAGDCVRRCRAAVLCAVHSGRDARTDEKGVHPILIICMSAVGGVVFGFALHLPV